MAVAALVLYTVWLLWAFVLRTALQIRRTGDSGFRGVTRTGPVETLAGVGFVVALLVGVAAPIAALAGLAPIAPLSSGFLGGLGAVLASLGVLATVAAQTAMGTSWRVGVDPDERTGLVDTGVFAVVRNPVFSAMVLTAVGLCLMVPNVLAVIGLAGLVVAIQVQVRRVEEPYLRSVHGDAYARYETTVGRFFPGLGRRHGLGGRAPDPGGRGPDVRLRSEP